jgi:hypothetical protein
MINAVCLQEGPITAVCATQTVNLSIYKIILSRND